VSIQDVNQALAENFGMKEASGALIGSVAKDSAASKAGIEPGDVILKFDGKPISRSSELPPMVARLAPGSTVPMQAVARRHGEERQRDDRRARGQDDRRFGEGKRRPGQARRRSASALGRGKKSSGITEGVVVEDVTGAAARAGVKPAT
jgi:serine protease Do